MLKYNAVSIFSCRKYILFFISTFSKSYFFIVKKYTRIEEKKVKRYTKSMRKYLIRIFFPAKKICLYRRLVLGLLRFSFFPPLFFFIRRDIYILI